jgi:hypothetical protein
MMRRCGAGKAMLALLLQAVAVMPSSAQERPETVLAAHIRTQGYPCVKPKNAVRETRASRPDGAVWLVECANARYRVRLIPDMAAKIERVPSVSHNDRR